MSFGALASETMQWVPAGWSTYGGLVYATGVDTGNALAWQTPAGWQTAAVLVHWASVAPAGADVRWRIKWQVARPGDAPAPVTMPYVDAEPAGAFVFAAPVPVGMITCTSEPDELLTLTVERLGATDLNMANALLYGVRLERIT